jgi:hypothetical protein
MGAPPGDISCERCHREVFEREHNGQELRAPVLDKLLVGPVRFHRSSWDPAGRVGPRDRRDRIVPHDTSLRLRRVVAETQTSSDSRTRVLGVKLRLATFPAYLRAPLGREPINPKTYY